MPINRNARHSPQRRTALRHSMHTAQTPLGSRYQQNGRGDQWCRSTKPSSFGAVV